MTAKCTSIDYDNNLRPGADKEGERGLHGSHVVPPPPPVPPSPLEPSAVQRVDSPSGGRVHRGGDLPSTSSTPVGSASSLVDPSLPPLLTPLSPSSPGKPSLPPDVKPLPGCSDPDFCVGGLDHLCYRAPGGADPTRDQIVWVTRRYFNQ